MRSVAFQLPRRLTQPRWPLRASWPTLPYSTTHQTRYQSQSQPTKALIFGAGSIGSVYGWFLHKAGCAVTTVCRSNYTQVKQHGYLIKSVKWGDHKYYPKVVSTASEAASHGPYDYIIVAAKAFPETHTLIADAVTPGAAIVLAQNGIGIEDAYAKAYPSNTIISGVVYLPTTQVEPGVVVHSTPLECFEIGTYPATAPAQADHPAKQQACRLRDLWTAAGATSVLYDDVQSRRWSKLALNASLNPLCALTLCDDANFLRSSEAAIEMAYTVMREVARVASAYGYDNVTEELMQEHMARHIERLVTGGKMPSMLQDIKLGRGIEVDAILGNLVKLADDKGVEVSNLKMLYVLAKGLNFAVTKGEGWKEGTVHKEVAKVVG